jgi:hypothetical protein
MILHHILWLPFKPNIYIYKPLCFIFLKDHCELLQQKKKNLRFLLNSSAHLSVVRSCLHTYNAAIKHISRMRPEESFRMQACGTPNIYFFLFYSFTSHRRPTYIRNAIIICLLFVIVAFVEHFGLLALQPHNACTGINIKQIYVHL